jgi:hypothetical protein
MINLLTDAAIDKNSATGEYTIKSLEEFKTACNSGTYKEAFEKVVKDMGHDPNNLDDNVYKSVIDKVTQTSVSSKSKEQLESDLETAKREQSDFERDKTQYETTKEELKEIETKKSKHKENLEKIKNLTGNDADFGKNIPNPLKDSKDSDAYKELRKNVLKPTGNDNPQLLKDDGSLNIEEVLSKINTPSLEDTTSDEAKLKKV